MPTITERPTTVSAPKENLVVDQANAALVLGSGILAQLAGVPSTTTVNVPAQVFQDLANAVVRLSAAVQGLQAQKAPVSSMAPAASTSPKIDADIKVTSNYSGSSPALAQLSEWAGTLREKAADLGIKVEIGVTASYGVWELHIKGQAPKDKLDELKKAASALIAQGQLFSSAPGRVEALKYDLI